MKRLAALAMLLMSIASARADHRLTFIPSLEMTEVNDDNVNYSPDEPLADRVRRVTPSLALRFDSARWTARISSSLDSEQYAMHRSLSDQHARERGTLSVGYRANPRLSFLFDASFVRTNTVADLNAETELSAPRLRGQSFDVRPSARFRLSPRTTLTASMSSDVATVVDGTALRSQDASLGLERRVTPDLIFTVDYQHSRVLFHGLTSQSVDSHLLLAGWTRDLSAHDRLILRAGPRVSDHSPSLDLAASLSHKWRLGSMELSLLRNQTAVIGYVGPVESESVQAKFSVAPNGHWSAYAAPAVFRTTQAHSQGIVYRVSAGARYTIASFLSAGVTYNRDVQHGAINPLWANARFSHSTLSLGLVTRWNDPDRMR